MGINNNVAVFSAIPDRSCGILNRVCYSDMSFQLAPDRQSKGILRNR